MKYSSCFKTWKKYFFFIVIFERPFSRKGLFFWNSEHFQIWRRRDILITSKKLRVRGRQVLNSRNFLRRIIYLFCRKLTSCKIFFLPLNRITNKQPKEFWEKQKQRETSEKFYPIKWVLDFGIKTWVRDLPPRRKIKKGKNNPSIN